MVTSFGQTVNQPAGRFGFSAELCAAAEMRRPTRAERRIDAAGGQSGKILYCSRTVRVARSRLPNPRSVRRLSDLIRPNQTTFFSANNAGRIPALPGSTGALADRFLFQPNAKCVYPGVIPSHSCPFVPNRVIFQIISNLSPRDSDPNMLRLWQGKVSATNPETRGCKTNE
jgi:hypothetical protein